MSQQQIKDHLARGAGSLVDTSVQTPELRPLYARTLLEAFRQESDRRRSAPREVRPGPAGPRQHPPGTAAVPAVLPDDDADAARLASSSLQGPTTTSPAPGNGLNRKDDAKLPGHPDQKDSITIETILDSPKSFEDRTITLDELYKIGTRLTLLRGQGTPSWSLPVGGDDDRLICPGEAKVIGSDGYLVLDGGLAPLLEKVFDQLKFRAANRPTYKCTMTITVRPRSSTTLGFRSQASRGWRSWGLRLPLVAQRQYEKAFWTVQVSPDRAFVTHGDGAAWVERLGGEEKFVKPLRRKLRDLQRRIIADREHTIVGSVLQAELGRAVNMAITAQQQHDRFARAMIGVK